MRHTYSCPVRWADMDALGHVNNVVYSDYLQEARADMLRLHARLPVTGALLEGTLVASQRLQYAAPLVFDAQPVQVDVWVAELRAASFTLAYEVYRPGSEPGERTVYARAHTVMAPYVFAEERPRRLTEEERAGLSVYLEPVETPRGPFTAPRHGGLDDIGHASVTVRFSDVDVYGHANNVIYLEYFQEARITLFSRLRETVGLRAGFPALVVAEQEVEHRRPMVMRETPYDAWTWASRMGRTSMVLEAEIRDAPAGSAPGELMARGRFAMVFVDPATGAPTPPPESLAELLREGSTT